MSSGAITVLVVVGLAAIVGLVVLAQMLNVVQQGTVGVVKRLGEYQRTHEPGSAAGRGCRKFVDDSHRSRYERRERACEDP